MESPHRHPTASPTPDSNKISFKPPHFFDSKHANNCTNHRRESFHIDPGDYILTRIVLYSYSFITVALCELDFILVNTPGTRDENHKAALMTFRQINRTARIALLLTVTCFNPQALYATDDQLAQGRTAEEIQESSNDTGVATESSKWGKFLPLPIFVTEPAIGEGLGATLIYFHHDDEELQSKFTTSQEIDKTGERSKSPPVATGIFGFYTNSDTAAVGVGHSNRFADDHFRLRVAAVEARINSFFYIGDRPVGFQLEGSLLFADLKSRLGDSDAFFGLSMSYADAGNNYRVDEDEIDGVNLVDFGFVDAGLAASFIYDTRDNTILPADGYLLELTGWRYGEAMGGDFDYDTARLRGLWFTELAENYVLGVRIDASSAYGDVPFFAAPYVRLRGIPALRYQGEVAGAFELEARRQLGDRWLVSLFAGVGSVKVGEEQTKSRDDIRTIGIGTRYLALSEQDAWVGLDIARGPEDLAWYIQIGSPW